MDKAWKRAERQVAKFFGVNRTPLSGGNGRITRSDTLHPTLFIETKYFGRTGFGLIESLFDYVSGQAKAEHKTPVVCLKRARSAGFLIVLRESDLINVAIAVADNHAAKLHPEFWGKGLVDAIKEAKCPK